MFYISDKRYIIVAEGGEKMGMDGNKSRNGIVQSAAADLCCGPGGCGSGMRSFLTKEEKGEMLKEYKESLEKEIQAVSERISELKKEK